MKKLMLIATIVMAGFVMMPSVYAADITVNTYKQVTDITNDAGHPNGAWTPVRNTGSEKEAVFVYDVADLKVIDKEKDGGDRPVDNAAWIGLLIEAPDVTGGTVDPYWLGSFKPENKGRYVSFEKETGGDYNDKYTIWVPITAQELQEVVEADGEDAELVRSYTIRWGGESDTKNVQTITVKIKASGVTLVADTAGEEEATWDSEDYEAAVDAYTVAHTIPVEEEKEDNGPDTADINLYGLLTIILASSLGLGYIVRKRMN